MTEKIDDKAVELLEQLAIKMGTTADQIWEILIQQASVAGIFDILMSLFFVSISMILGYISLWFSREIKDDADAVFPMLGFATVTLLVCVVSLAFAYGAATAFLNPDYWALKQVIGLMENIN